MVRQIVFVSVQQLGPGLVSTSPASRRRREAAAGEASPSLEKTVGEPTPWKDMESEPLGRCLSGRSHSSLRRKVVGAAT